MHGEIGDESFRQNSKPDLTVANGSQTSTVCVLDDDASVLKATGRLLRSAGWGVQTFNDPVSFLCHAQSHHPQVVVIDILMPVMNGLEVQTRLRSVSPSTRVIVLTSKDDTSVRSQAMAAGASAFFLKPVSDEEFLAGIQSAYSEQ
jgi:FixJ family two-component response regulator